MTAIRGQSPTGHPSGQRHRAQTIERAAGVTVVTGMHRSGTSLIANLLSEYGLDFGDPATFLRADQWNARGYFEQRDVLDLNSRIITGLPRTGGRLATFLGQLRYTAMPGRRTLQRRAARLQPALAELGRKYVGKSLKDPRFCLTLGGWKKSAAVGPIVVCLRSPLETVYSLRRRQRYPIPLGLRFWNYHIENLLRELEGERVLAVDYNALAGNAPVDELHALRSFFGLELSETELLDAHARTFDRRLLHCRSSGAELLPRRTRELWEALLELRMRR